MTTEQTITQSAIAEHLDMSTRNLRDVLNAMAIDWRQATLDEIRIQYIRVLREAAAGRGDAQQAAARARRDMADAQLKEMELAEKLRLVVSVADIEPLLVDLMKQLQTTLLEAGQRAIQAMETTHDVKVDDDLILGPLRAALGNLAARGDQLVSNLSGEPCATVSSATQAAGGVDRKKRQAAGGQ